MKKVLYLILTIILCIPFTSNALEINDLYSENVIIYNKDEDKILYEKNADEITNIASLTKIMTTIVAIENIEDLDDVVVITNEMLRGIPWDASVAGLKVGDKLTYRDLLYASMLPSGADATNSLAVSLTGSVNAFVEKMNAKARELNLDSTNFVNTTGLDVSGHYSTVRDILSLLNYCLENETFKEVFETKTYTTTNGIKLESTIDTYSKRLSYNLSYILGGKTGYTSNAGQCLAALSNIDDTNIITITTNAPFSYEKPRNIIDMNTLYNALRDNYAKTNLVEVGDTLKTLKTKYAKEDEIDIVSNVDISRFIEKPYDKNELKFKYSGTDIINSTVKKGTKVGSVEVYYKGELIDTIEAFTSNNLNFSIFKYVLSNIHYYIAILLIIIITVKIIRKPKRKRKKS